MLQTQEEQREQSRAEDRELIQQALVGRQDAYKRLVRDGLQPRAIDGSAALEAKATTRAEIEA